MQVLGIIIGLILVVTFWRIFLGIAVVGIALVGFLYTLTEAGVI